MTILVDHLLTTTLGTDCTAEPLSHVPHYPSDLDCLAVRRVFVTITDHGQVGHSHHFTDIDRFGDALCHPCSAAGWSPGWVRAGVFGEGTADWIVRALDWRCTQVEHDHDDVAHLVTHELLGAQVVKTLVPQIGVHTDGSEPAYRRPGIPVPQMQRGVLTVQS